MKGFIVAYPKYSIIIMTYISLLAMNFIVSADTDVLNSKDFNSSDRKFVPESRFSKITTPSINLSETPECADDIRWICPASVIHNNFAVLNCLQNDKRREDENLTPECHHLIWNFKRNLTLDDRFAVIAKHMCHEFFENQTECVPLENAQGQLLSCLIDVAENAVEPECRLFLKKMKAISFSDYRLIYKFTEKCLSDIEKFQCHHLEMDSEDLHSQGETIECLSKQIDKLTSPCYHEILHIAELQGEDFHLDRPLFFACREDRERFCEEIQPGEGRVYNCLMRHKREKGMSRECQAKLFQRERLIVHDYKIDRSLVKACNLSIIIHLCEYGKSDQKEIKLSHILLCLQAVLRKGYIDPLIPGECQAELLKHRQTLMESYQLIPELAAACEKHILPFCGPRIVLGGETLHCLMNRVKPNRYWTEIINDSCRRELELLLHQSDVGEDWSVDPVLQDRCQTVVDAVCSHEKHGEGRVMNCLMKNFDSQYMDEVCKKYLLQVQYFIARDFKLDPILFTRCKKYAEKYCNAHYNWNYYDEQSHKDPENGFNVLRCLFRYAEHPEENVEISRYCLNEVKRVMRQRAVSVYLMPEIEKPCMSDLIQLYRKNFQEIKEMELLQKNFKDLSPDCQKAISDVTPKKSENLDASCSTNLYKHYHWFGSLLYFAAAHFMAMVLYDVFGS